MHDPANELPRIHIPRTPVNKGKIQRPRDAYGSLGLKMPYWLRHFGLPILFCPPPEHLPSGLHGHHRGRL
jgi:hypothetical protein